jgi:hypothetical protein
MLHVRPDDSPRVMLRLGRLLGAHGLVGDDGIALFGVIGGVIFENVYHKCVSWLREPL